MGDIGERIIRARKAKGMTQEELAAALNVSRPTIANWETGRRLPDIYTLRRLSSVLDCSFADEAAPEPEEEKKDPLTEGTEAEEKSEEEAVRPVIAEDRAEAPEAAGKKRPTRKVLLTVVAFAAVAVLLFAVLLPIIRPAERIVPYTAVSGKQYLPEDFQERAERTDGELYLTVTPTLTTVPNDPNDFWMYTFTFRESSGKMAEIESVEIAIFSIMGKNTTYTYTAEDLSSFGLETKIAANGEWSIDGGLPVQKEARGVGVLMTCRDEEGNERLFTGYQALK